jgi:hypothetical protein
MFVLVSMKTVLVNIIFIKKKKNIFSYLKFIDFDFEFEKYHLDFNLLIGIIVERNE